MNRKLNLLPLAGLALVLVSCGNEDTLPDVRAYENPSTSAQEFGKYAAIGNSLTAGFQSGAWGNPDHIEYSFPNQLAHALGIHDFDQVILGGTGVASASVAGLPVGGNQILNFDANGTSSVAYSPLDLAALGVLQGGAAANMDFTAPRNFGIPGITLAAAAFGDLVNVAQVIPYAGMYTNATSATLSQVDLVTLHANAEFITCWLGNNDVLGYVTSGGVGAAAGGQDITPPANFTLAINYTLGQFAAVEYVTVLNIPDVTDIPFVTYPNQVLQAAGVVALWGADLAGDSVLVNLATDYVLLSGLSALRTDLADGTQNTLLGPQYVLSAVEAAEAQDAVDTFNSAMESAVMGINTVRGNALPPVLYIDMNGFFNDVVAEGLTVGDNRLTVVYGSGGIFSLDGVHPTALGSAAVANRVIRGMNAGWNRTIQEIDLADLFGVAPGL